MRHEAVQNQIRQAQTLLGLISHHDEDAPLSPEVITTVCLTSTKLLEEAVELIKQDA